MDGLKAILHIITALLYGVILTIIFTNVTNDTVVLGIVAVWICLLFLVDIVKFMFDLYDN